jgi:hypothetical protein
MKCREGTEREYKWISPLSLTLTPEGDMKSTLGPGPLYHRKRGQVPTLQAASWASGPDRAGLVNLGSTGIWTRDRPARSLSLYLLRYPGQFT